MPPVVSSEKMPQLFFLGLEIFFGMRAGGNFAGDALDDVDSGAFQSFHLIGIVR
jgi:hypothetical protein